MIWYNILMKEITQKLQPTSGYIIIDPLEKDNKSQYIAVQDPIDKPHKGTVVAIGPSKITDYGIKLESPVKVGDVVLYSIAGCESFKTLYDGDPRHEFIVSPFNRILVILDK